VNPSPGNSIPLPADRRRFFILNLSLFVSSLGMGIVVPLLPLYASQMGASGISLGVFFASFNVSRGLAMPFMGRLSDRTGRKRFLSVGLLAYTFLSLAYVASRDIYALTLTRTLQGIASAMVVPIGMAYAGDLSPQGREGTYMGILNVSLFGGFGFGPFLGGVLSDYFGIDASFYAMGFLSLVTFLLILLCLPGEPVVKRGDGQQLLPMVRILKERFLVGVLSFRLANAVSRGLYVSFLPLFANLEGGLSSSEIGIVISANLLATSALQAPAGRLADLVSRRVLVTAGGLAYATLFGILPLSSGFSSLLVISILLGGAGALPLPAALALMADRGQGYGMGTLMASFNVAQSVGLVVGPLLGGFLLDASGLLSVFVMGGIVGVAGSGIFHYRTAGAEGPGGS